MGIGSGYKMPIPAPTIIGSNMTAVYRFSYLLSCEEIHANPTPAPVAEDKIFEAASSEITEFGSEKYIKTSQKRNRKKRRRGRGRR